MERVGRQAVRAKGKSTNIARVVLVIGFIGLALLAVHLERAYMSGTAWVIADVDWGRFLADLLISIGPELAGIGIGVVTIDTLNERRQMQQLKAQLIRQVGSRHNDVAEPAVRELEHYGWLEDGLRGAALYCANLEGVSIVWADLRGAALGEANLEGANLEGTNFSDASLWMANLAKAILYRANLRNTELSQAFLNGASLVNADLTGADLTMAQLLGTVFHGAILTDVNLARVDMRGAEVSLGQLRQARSLEGATMPDGVRLKDDTGVRAFRILPNPNGPTFEEWAGGRPDSTQWGSRVEALEERLWAILDQVG